MEILEVTTTTNTETKDKEMRLFRQLLLVAVLPEVFLPETQVSCYRDNNEKINSQIQVNIPVYVIGIIKYFPRVGEIDS